MELSRDAAIAAAKEQQRANHILALKLKKDLEEKFAEKDEKKKEDWQKKKEVVETVQS